MAGDWIKFEVATLDKPEVRQMARVLGVKHGEALELLLRFWAWMDRVSVDGSVDGLVDRDVDEMMCCAGFSGVMQLVGWLKCDNEKQRIEMPNADRHNGKSAKKRALSNSSQSKWRANVDGHVDGHVDKGASTKSSTREEKRREEIKTTTTTSSAETPTDGFVKFWTSFPAQRKVAKAACWKVWHRKRLDSLADKIVAHVEAMSATDSWKQGFCPAPLTYLNQERFGDGVPAATVHHIGSNKVAL